MGGLGFLGPELPESCGGLGVDCVTSGLLLEQIAYGDFNVAYVNCWCRCAAKSSLAMLTPEWGRNGSAL